MQMDRGRRIHTLRLAAPRVVEERVLGGERGLPPRRLRGADLRARLLLDRCTRLRGRGLALRRLCRWLRGRF